MMRKFILCVFLALLFAAPSAMAQTNAVLYSVLFGNEAAAQKHCPSDAVVWVDNRTNIYYKKGQPSYGGTIRGAYACEQDTKKIGSSPAE